MSIRKEWLVGRKFGGGNQWLSRGLDIAGASGADLGGTPLGEAPLARPCAPGRGGLGGRMTPTPEGGAVKRNGGKKERLGGNGERAMDESFVLCDMLVEIESSDRREGNVCHSSGEMQGGLLGRQRQRPSPPLRTQQPRK
ncbi:hypothetical protein Tco_0895929 [Tanacetum coccineum]|uniref:Uncharacterized protein n=1 Tax=Tanacetum coccineum TaxID=301880 RepID=A0ABQ5CI29_9ASTR